MDGYDILLLFEYHTLPQPLPEREGSKKATRRKKKGAERFMDILLRLIYW